MSLYGIFLGVQIPLHQVFGSLGMILAWKSPPNTLSGGGPWMSSGFLHLGPSPSVQTMLVASLRKNRVGWMDDAKKKISGAVITGPLGWLGYKTHTIHGTGIFTHMLLIFMLFKCR